MKIVKFITGVSKKLAKVESWKLPSKNKTPALPAPPVDEEKAKAQPVVEEKVEEEKVEDVKLERVVEEAPIQSKKAEDDVPPPKPPGKRKALLIGIQFYPDPEAAELQEPPVAPSVPPLPSAPSGHVASTAAAANTASTATPPTADTATRTTPSLAASSSLASITSRAKAKFMQTCSISSPLASASTLPSSSFSPASPPPLVGTRKKSYAAAVSPSAGLSTAPSAWPALSSAVPVKSPITPVTPKTAAGMTSPTTPSRVPLKPGRSLVLQQQKSFVEKTAKKEKEKEKEKEKKKRKKEKSGHTHERSTSSAQSFALKGCHRDVEEMEKMLVDLYGYSPSSITTMIDTPANVQSKSHLLPTRENIITQLQELVKGAEPGDRFFFFFAGHSTQQPTDSMDEEDGMDELIVTYDNLLIQDDELREKLVKPLPPGVKLTAVFDSCHSASLLDLEHFRCNRVWVPWMNKGKRRSLSKLNAVVRRAAAPLSPRRSPMVLSPMSTSNMLSPIFDYERIGRAFSRKRRKQAEAARALAPGGDATTGADGTTLGAMDEAKELGRAQERARGLDAVLSESLANVPEGTSAGVAKPAVASGETVANATANKENVKSKRPDPRTKQRAKIVPPPVFNGWERSSMDRMMVAGGGSGSSEVASLASSKGAVRPVSILASGPSTVVKAVGGNQTPLEGAATNATRPKPKIKIKTTSLPLEVPTRPVTPIGGTASTSVVQNAHVTFTPQTYTPQSSRRDSVVVAVAQQQGSRRDSVVVQHPGMGGRRESGHGGPAMVGMSQVLEEAFAKHAERKKGDTQLTDRTDRTDRTWPASDVSDDSGVFWLVDEPEEMDEEDAGEESRGGGVKSGGPSRMASFGATSSIAVTTTMTAHALNSAAAAAGSPVRALSVSKGKTSEGEKGKKTKRLFGRHPRRCMSPEALFCDGWCWKRYEKEGVDGKTHMPFVISLSAAKDGQQAWEDASGASMTQHLVKILREDPTPTMGTLLGQISHDLHTTYLDIHSRARDYRKKAREVNKVRMLKGKQMKDVMAVEMNNFQDPQVSSLWPLDMKREVWDP